jgi:hypothetical protein
MTSLLTFAFLLLTPATAQTWTAPVEVRHDDKLALSYRARYTGEYLVVETRVEKGWHTFALDNEVRHTQKLAGKPSLGVEKSTAVKVEEGLKTEGAWLQTEPKDFSQPEIRHYTYGFNEVAHFAIKGKPEGAGAAKVNIKGQACTESVCKNIDVTLAVPLQGSGNGFDAAKLIPVRQ